MSLMRQSNLVRGVLSPQKHAKQEILAFTNGRVSGQSFLWQGDFIKSELKENKGSSFVSFQIDKPLRPAAEQQLHLPPARRARLPKTSQSPPYVSSELICVLEQFQDNSLNVLHSTQICD